MFYIYKFKIYDTERFSEKNIIIVVLCVILQVYQITLVYGLSLENNVTIINGEIY